MVPEIATNEIAFTSDTQAPMWIETVRLKPNFNEKATELIFQEIAKTHPLSCFVLGDVVSLSYKAKKWKLMDQYLNNCRSNNIPVYGCLGNHEYIGNAKKGLKNFQDRFQEHVRTGYVEVVDSIAVVLVNSNFSSMTAQDTAIQAHWYAHTMDSLDHAAGVCYIVVACHHSPYTNSHIVSPSTGVQQNFVPAYLKTHKAKLFLSGHSHNFEYFKHEGKDFLVIGGGGGLHQPMVAPEKRMSDAANGYNPMFHYLTIKRNRDSLLVTSHRLKEDFSGFANGLTISIAKPN